MDSYDYSAFAVRALTFGAAACLWYWLVGAVQRLYFSPIAAFPGPKLAALTFWYEFYYDVVKNGQYTFEIARMHKIYGPIVRVNPFELHVETPEFYEKLYTGGGKKRDRWGWFTAQFGTPESIVASKEHDKHRIRRAAINPLFSKAAVRRLQPVLEERLDKLLARFADFQRSEKAMTVSLAYEALTNDIVMQYSFARSDNRIEMENFDYTLHNASVKGSAMGVVTKQFPWILPLLQSLPEWLLLRINPDMSSFVNLQNSIVAQVLAIQSGSNEEWKDVSHNTIFHEILSSDLPPSEKSTQRLCDDGQVTVIAGTLTTAWTLSVATFYLLSQPDTLRRLKDELQTGIPQDSQQSPLSILEQLPYLTACIQESLRLSYGVSTRLQRICPDEVLIFNDGKVDWTIPAGTPVSMTSTIIHHDPRIFPDSHTFLPERWLENPHLNKYLVSFSKGSRQCVGINLAYAELYLTLARIFRRYGSKDVHGDDDLGYLELFETTLRDVEIMADLFVPNPPADSEGVRIKTMEGGRLIKPDHIRVIVRGVEVDIVAELGALGDAMVVRMGLLPEQAQAGDRIYILYDRSVPVVLQKCDGYYSFIGECYIDG